MQPGYRPYPQQQMPLQRPPPQGLMPNARRVGPAPMMAPGMPHPMAPMPMTPHHPMHHGGAPMTPQQHMSMQQQQQQQVPPPHAMQMHAQGPPQMAMHHAPMGAPHAQPGAGGHMVAPMGVAPPGAVVGGVGGHHMQTHAAMQQQQQAVAHQQQQAAAVAAAAAAAAQQQAAHHASEAAKRRSRKPADKTIPDGVEDVIIGDGVQRYRELRDFERRLDATMTRKRLDIVDSMHRSLPKRFKTLRIWISNTVENQLWQGGGRDNVDSFDYAGSEAASYRVKIEGRLLDDDDDDEEEKEDKKEEGATKAASTTEDKDVEAMETDGKEDAKPASKEPRYRFTHFFRAMTVDYPVRKTAAAANGGVAAGLADGTQPVKTVEWKRPEQPRPANPGAPAPAVAEFDELTFKRPGDENVNITINLFRHEDPERFALDEALAEIVDMQEATRAEAVMGLFEYIRLLHLQEDEEKRNFRCDELLRRLINNDIGYIPMLHEYVNAHIRQLPPVQLAYTIRVDEAFHRGQSAGSPTPTPTVYDVRVAVDDPLRAQLRPFVASPGYIHLLRDVAGLDEQLAVLVQAVGMSKSKHEFLTALARDPAAFVRQWLSSQKRDLDVLMGESVRGGTAAASLESGLASVSLASTAGGGGGSGSTDAWGQGGADSVWASQNARESVNLLLAKQPLIPRGP